MEKPKVKMLQILVATIIAIVLFVGGWLIGSINMPKEEPNNDEEGKVVIAEVRHELASKHEQEIRNLEESYDQQILEMEKQLAETKAELEKAIQDEKQLIKTESQIEVIVEKETIPLEQFTQIVRRHDTIWGYAARLQNPPQKDYVQKIIDVNQVDPYLLQIGQEIVVPLP